MPFSWYFDDERHQATFETADDIGQMLTMECVRSVSYRYPNDDVAAGELPGPVDPYYLEPYRFDPVHAEGAPRLIALSTMTAVLHPVVCAADLAGAIRCYEYQTCEHPEWDTSEAYRFLAALKDHILRTLPGGDGVWEIS